MSVRKSAAVQATEERYDIIRALIVCILVVIFIRSFVVEPFRIPSRSMEPSLLIGDHLFVSKFSYSFSIPFTKIQLFDTSDPKRGDVIVFLFPRDESLNYIKRVIGIPGDRVKFHDDKLWVNDKLLQQELVTDSAEIESVLGPNDSEGILYKEHIDDKVHYIRLSKNELKAMARPNFEEVVPEGSYFVLGDNRDDSYDSRFWGVVKKENIKGKAQMIWISLDQQGVVSTWKKVRWNRCFTLIR